MVHGIRIDLPPLVLIYQKPHDLQARALVRQEIRILPMRVEIATNPLQLLRIDWSVTRSGGRSNRKNNAKAEGRELVHLVSLAADADGNNGVCT